MTMLNKELFLFLLLVVMFNGLYVEKAILAI